MGTSFLIKETSVKHCNTKLKCTQRYNVHLVHWIEVSGAFTKKIAKCNNLRHMESSDTDIKKL